MSDYAKGNCGITLEQSAIVAVADVEDSDSWYKARRHDVNGRKTASFGEDANADITKEEINCSSINIALTVQGLYTKLFPGSGIFGRVLKRSSLACLLYSEVNKASAAFGGADKSMWCCRRRIKTKPIESPEPTNSGESNKGDDKNEEYETAMFVPGKGLIGGWFYHESDPLKKMIREDRAILFQSEENYQRLKENPLFSSSFDGIDYLESPSFGEQVIVSGCEVSDLAIGDVFEVEGCHSTLVVEITAPRKPCYKMNKKHATRHGAKGIQAYAHHNCLGGWFARVLIGGELRDGMKLIRKTHPNSKWTLPNTQKALYGEGTRLQSNMCCSSWNRGREELVELIGLPQLGECEWKAEARKLLLKMDGIDVKTVSPDLIDPHVDPMRAKLYQVTKQYNMFFPRGNAFQMFVLFGLLCAIATAVLFNHIAV